MSLTLYKKKRNFKKSPEPSDSKPGGTERLTFVVQKHDASHLHYDFRLEMGGVLKSWAVPKGPSMNPNEKRLAVMVEDHPLKYGKFYGEIPEGNYGAGIVEIWDKGTYAPMKSEENNDDEKLLLSELKKGDIKIILHGHYLKGAFALVRMNDGKNKNWLLIKKKDKYAESNFDINKLTPVKLYESNNEDVKKVPEKKKEVSKGSESIDESWETLKNPMLAKLTDRIFDSPEWLYEIKFDGYRAVTKISNGEVEMVSRNGKSFNSIYKPIIQELENVNGEIILDGEIVIENRKGISEFQLLQNYQKTKKGKLKYYVFDILYLNGHDLTGLSLKDRKELLAEFFKHNKFKDIFQTDYILKNGTKYFKKLAGKNYEGVIAKNINGTYHSGKRSDSWLKVKTGMQQEAVICGYTEPQKSRQYIGSLILGVYEDDRLIYIGNCGTGFTEATLKELHGQLEPLVIPDYKFESKPDMKGLKGMPVWVKPELVCDVKFSEWTNDGRMRHPVFNGLRIDKNPEDVSRETNQRKMKNSKSEIKKDQVLTVGRKKINVTNLSKLYWKKENISKGDLINYYISVSDFILPYLKNRPESLNRHPNGINAPGFYQKDMDTKHLPDWAKTVKLYSDSNKKYIDYLICNDTATLIYMANLGCIEINPWNSVYKKPDKPDYMIIDLDPGKIGFKEVIKTALVTKEVCDEIGVKSFCKTSGATGLHIYLPLNAKYEYEQVRVFAKLLSLTIHSRLPETTSIERSVNKRKNKIYLDYLQNSRGQTVAAPYSVRPMPLATVSTPLKWSELKDNLKPEDFSIFNIKKRLDKVGDLWKGVLGSGIPLLKALKNLEKIKY